MTTSTRPQPDQSGIGWPTPRKPTGATDITPDRWMWIEPELEPWFAPFHPMLTDLIGDGPFVSLRARLAAVPWGPRWAGQLVPRLCRDGQHHAEIVILRGMTDENFRRFTAHEIGHLADLVAHEHLLTDLVAPGAALAGTPLRGSSEAVARAFETIRWASGSRGTDAVEFVRRARRRGDDRVSGASHAAQCVEWDSAAGSGPGSSS